jgi:hypothetical protein
MPLAGVHLLEVAGKSWYSLTNLQGTQTIRLVQVQTV